MSAEHHAPPPPQRDAVDPDERDAYDSVIARQRSYRYDEYNKQFDGAMEDTVPANDVQPYFLALLNSPKFAEHISELGVFFRTRGERSDSFRHADRYWVDLLMGKDMRCNGIVLLNMPDAVSHGVRPEAIRAMWEGRDRDLTPEEQQLTEFVRAFMKAEVSAEQFAGLEKRYGRRGAVDFFTWVGFLQMTCFFWRNFNIPQPSDAAVEAMIDRVVSGSIELPDPYVRVPTVTT